MAQRAFIVRPFGTKKGINFDAVQAELIDKAMAKVGTVGDTTGQFAEAGNIRIDMFEQLLVADVVIADISVHNANVFYELGIRHALRGRQTVLIRAKVSKPRAEQTAEDEVPFDLRTDRYVEYDHTKPEECVDALARALEMTQAGDRPDSPVFLSLPKLQEQEPSRFLPVPQDFREAVDDAKGKNDYARLGLLAAEAAGLTWQVEGWRLVGRAQFKLGRHRDAARTLERIRGVDRDDREANLLLGTSFQKLGDLDKSDAALRRVLAHESAPPRDLSEAWALLGSNDKVRWRQQWTVATDNERAVAAMESDFLSRSIESYRKGFSVYLNNYYPGLNALALSAVRLELIRMFPDEWEARFDDSDDAAAKLRQMQREHDKLAGAVALALDIADDTDGWVAISRADHLFLTAEKDAVADKAYVAAVSTLGAQAAASARAQLDLYAALGVKAARVKLCLSRFPAAATSTASSRAGHVVVFTGHRVDPSDQAEPRFPQACVDRARAAIRERLERLKPACGIAAAASGGDILFHEVCRELGIPTQIRLAVNEHLFANESVAAKGAEQWVDRYWSLIQANRDALKLLSDDTALPDWLKRKTNYSVWQRANIWMLEEALTLNPERLTLIALWDGKSGKGPGGTRDMVEQAKTVHAGIEHIDTTSICA